MATWVKKPPDMKSPLLTSPCRIVSKLFLATLALALTVLAGVAQATLLMGTDFEGSSSLPAGWSQSQVSGSATWTVRTGSAAGNPSSAHGGSNNANLYISNTNNNQTDLISPTFSTDGYSNVSLSFWHVQPLWSPDQDELKVFYSSNGGTSWTQLAHYTASVTSWTQRTLAIPVTSANTRIKFEGNAKYGYGVCLDDIEVNGTPDSIAEISVAATDADASEVGPDTGTWTLTRSGLTTSALTVNFSLGGTATSGDDYSINVTSPVSFAAGETTKVVTLTPVDDAVGSEVGEVATLTVTSGTGYVIGNASADISIYDDEGYDVNILVIGSTRDSGERHNSGVWWNSSKPAFTPNSAPFSPTEIGTQLQSILDQDNRGSINVQVEERYMSQGGIIGSWTAYSYNLMTWFNYPFPADAEQARWQNLRGEGDIKWDYIVLIGDPYTMEYTPGMYSMV